MVAGTLSKHHKEKSDWRIKKLKALKLKMD